MNRFLAVILAAFIFGGILGWIACLWLYAVQMEEAIKKAEAQVRLDEAKKIGATMRHNQMCVEKWKRTEQCMNWH